MNDVVI